MVSCGMDWQKRSSGRRCDSHSRHAATVGAHTRKPIGFDILGKLCQICSRHTGDGEPTAHDCSKNFNRSDSESTSGSMEQQALVSKAHQLLDDHCALMETAVVDGDSSARAQMKWSNPNWMTHHNLTSTRLPRSGMIQRRSLSHVHTEGSCAEPIFLADPQHCTKLFSKKLFAMESKTI